MEAGLDLPNPNQLHYFLLNSPSPNLKSNPLSKKQNKTNQNIQGNPPNIKLLTNPQKDTRMFGQSPPESSISYGGVNFYLINNQQDIIPALIYRLYIPAWLVTKTN